MNDMSEQYYADMESARADAETAYFGARPSLLDSHERRSLFRAGFERAFRKMWNPPSEPKDQTTAGPITADTVFKSYLLAISAGRMSTVDSHTSIPPGALLLQHYTLSSDDKGYAMLYLTVLCDAKVGQEMKLTPLEKPT